MRPLANPYLHAAVAGGGRHSVACGVGAGRVEPAGQRGHTRRVVGRCLCHCVDVVGPGRRRIAVRMARALTSPPAL